MDGGRIVARLRKSRKFLGPQDGLIPSDGPLCSGAFFSIEPERLFPSVAPLEVEIGAGKGDFLLARAAQVPQHNFLAVELAGSVFRWLASRIERSGLQNLRALRADARPVVNFLLPAGSVAAFHIYFPDPWPKSRHSKHRLFTLALTDGLRRCLEPDGRIFVATDVDWYFEHIAGLFARCGFRLAAHQASGAQSTGFGRRFASAGKPIYDGCFQLSSAFDATEDAPVKVNEVALDVLDFVPGGRLAFMARNQ